MLQYLYISQKFGFQINPSYRQQLQYTCCITTYCRVYFSELAIKKGKSVVYFQANICFQNFRKIEEKKKVMSFQTNYFIVYLSKKVNRQINLGQF